MGGLRVAGFVLGGALVAVAGAVPDASAYTEPYYARVFTYAYTGSLGPGGSGNGVVTEGPHPVHGEMGPKWWDCGGACAFGPGAGLGYSSAHADPFAGAIHAEAGARNMSNTVAEWDVVTPFGTFHISPSYWGEGYTESYLHSTWRVESPDGSLAPGDPVSVTGALDLSGVLENGPLASYKAALSLTKRSNAIWLAGDESTNLGMLEDLYGRGQTEGFVLVGGDDPASLPRRVEFTRDFHVGDELVMELLLRAEAGAPNDGTPKEVWARFGQTLTGGITTSTPGAVLVAVPEPGTWAMVLGGLGLVAAQGLRSRASARRGSRPRG